MSAGFVDEARISVRAGRGGDGGASFHREKYKPRGGPDGGDGGRGGSVVLRADRSVGTLAEFRARRLFRAPDGGRGRSNNKRGADAEDLRISVPVGTIVHDLDADEVLADLAGPDATFVVARGGRGGRGNASVASAAERAPNFAERGEPGEERGLLLDLRVMADVGLIGPPNAGKSTLLRAVSAARPKVGDYPFTTLEPHLGVVEAGERRFVVADLPGLARGAAEGRGLGARFLRHAERCLVLAAVVDLAAADPGAELDAVLREVRSYDEELADRVRVIAGNKVDLEGAHAEAARAWADVHGAVFSAVSARYERGIDGLVDVLAQVVDRARAERPRPQSFAVYRPVTPDRIEVSREGEGFRVRSSRVERLVGMTPMENPRAVRHLQRRLRAMGVEAALSREGAKQGDEVYIGDTTFEYQPEEPAGRRAGSR